MYVIPCFDNTLKKIHISSTIFNEFTSTHYDDKYDGFGMLVKQYTLKCVKNINHTALIQECGANMEIVAF